MNGSNNCMHMYIKKSVGDCHYLCNNILGMRENDFSLCDEIETRIWKNFEN